MSLQCKASSIILVISAKLASTELHPSFSNAEARVTSEYVQQVFACLQKTSQLTGLSLMCDTRLNQALKFVRACIDYLGGDVLGSCCRLASIWDGPCSHRHSVNVDWTPVIASGPKTISNQSAPCRAVPCRAGYDHYKVGPGRCSTKRPHSIDFRIGVAQR
ncbi:hypothetical protein BJ170DRAFT_624585 [Xylariales sp. AK1849]|nr:hypothetical protein BJ170DRAFT_624585 [Xylariales sp. AK1849]